MLYQATKAELLEKLNLDLETLLGNENFVPILIGKYGFSHENLEKFAELLYEFVAASADKNFTTKCIANIGSIYKYLDENGSAISFNRDFILSELKQYE